jgi:hypothetical protein
MDFTRFKDSELQKFILYHARLEPGDKLEGKVIEVRKDNKVLFDFGRFRALAETNLTVKPNEKIKVIVVARVPKLKLRLEASGHITKIPPGVEIEEKKQSEDPPKLDIKAKTFMPIVSILVKNNGS